jgi:trk system potassium uptake protein TrkH
VSARTAGFATFNFATLNGVSVMILSLLMLIGASPASTGGGIKTTTVYTMAKSMISFARGKPTITGHKKISEESKMRAFTLFFVAIIVIFASIILILSFESTNVHVTLTNVLFEVFSAFGTVGLSMNLTPYLGICSKLLICVLMFFGRIGLITIMGMWNKSWNKPNVSNVDYLEEKIIIG